MVYKLVSYMYVRFWWMHEPSVLSCLFLNTLLIFEIAVFHAARHWLHESCNLEGVCFYLLLMKKLLYGLSDFIAAVNA